MNKKVLFPEGFQHSTGLLLPLKYIYCSSFRMQYENHQI